MHWFWEIFLTLTVGSLVSGGVIYCFHRYLKLSWLVFVFLPLLITPFWVFEIHDYSPFMWVKLYSVLPAVLLVLLLRTFEFRGKRKLFYLLYLFFCLNIAEAVVKAATAGTIPCYFNMATGILLILTIPSIQSFSVASEKPHPLEWKQSYVWILIYTLWNWTFVCLCFNESALRTSAILLGPLLVGFWNWRWWFQARVITLFFWLAISFTIHDISVITRSDHCSTSEMVDLLLTGSNLLAILLYAIHFYWKKRRQVFK